MTKQNSYKENWEEFKARRVVFFAMVIGWIPTTLIFGGGLSKSFDSMIPLSVVAITLLILVVVTAFRFIYWKCPRCHDFYMIKRPWYSLVRRSNKCVNCGLSKYAATDPDAE